MQIGKYLTRQRTVLLQGTTKEAVLREMVGALCEEDPRRDSDEILQALMEREKMLSSRIAPRVALPHAVLPAYGEPIVALGYSEAGVPWDSPGGETVNLVILSLCGRSYGKEHVTMLAEIANTLRSPSALERIEAADTAEELYDILQEPAAPARPPADAETLAMCRAMMHHAESVAEEMQASAVMVMADTGADPGFLRDRSSEVPLLVVTNETAAPPPQFVEPDHLLVVPGYGLAREHRVRLAFLFALAGDLVESGDRVVCLSGESKGEALNVLEVVDVGREFDVLLALRSELESGDISPHVFYRVLQIASKLAREGREGKPVGTIFIIGDYQNVRQHCYQLVINPFRGYPENERNILDPGLEETIKEFSRVDGASLVRGDGVIMSMGAYIQPEDAAQALQSGLGARHAAAMAVTMSTRAISVVISESTRRISIFQQGNLLLALDRAQQ
ncbi:MAG: PTS sugar transporter subunit IIA [Candidatus Brocadiia bacterium]